MLHLSVDALAEFITVAGYLNMIGSNTTIIKNMANLSKSKELQENGLLLFIGLDDENIIQITEFGVNEFNKIRSATLNIPVSVIEGMEDDGFHLQLAILFERLGLLKIVGEQR